LQTNATISDVNLNAPFLPAFFETAIRNIFYTVSEVTFTYDTLKMTDLHYTTTAPFYCIK